MRDFANFKSHLISNLFTKESEKEANRNKTLAMSSLKDIYFIRNLYLRNFGYKRRDLLLMETKSLKTPIKRKCLQNVKLLQVINFWLLHFLETHRSN